MRLATFVDGATGQYHVGVVRNDSMYPLDGFSGPNGMLHLIGSGSLAGISGATLGTGLSLNEVRLAAPIPRPVSNIMCLGRNYREHSQEMERAGRDAASKPTFFTKAVTSVVGPYDDISFDATLSTEIDWEVELAFVIGKRARSVSSNEALNYVFGYTVLNDVSARDLQYGYGGQFFYGKSLDGSCPMGPWIVTADEIPDPQDLSLLLTVNGEIKQQASTADMIFTVAETLSTLSRAMTLEPGQIVATGTPSGVGYARDPQEFLTPGDVMRSEISTIGILENRVREAS